MYKQLTMHVKNFFSKIGVSSKMTKLHFQGGQMRSKTVMVIKKSSLCDYKLSIDHIIILKLTAYLIIQKMTSFQITKMAVSALSVPFSGPKKCVKL